MSQNTGRLILVLAALTAVAPVLDGAILGVGSWRLVSAAPSWSTSSPLPGLLGDGHPVSMAVIMPAAFGLAALSLIVVRGARAQITG
jgi:hypothetical protein